MCASPHDHHYGVTNEGLFYSGSWIFLPTKSQ
jgi:hypothetical protein